MCTAIIGLFSIHLLENAGYIWAIHCEGKWVQLLKTVICHWKNAVEKRQLPLHLCISVHYEQPPF